MPATRKCCIVGCQSNSRFCPNLQFFQFPRPDNPYHKRWIEACHASMSHILPFKKPVLCSLHFMAHHIGGRRLTTNAVPTLKLDVPTNLKIVENQAMFDEIERSRKFAYINAVVYEWLVRANMNPQLRGSITHGMIKEKAETAKKIIACESFVPDNRWLNRFRETHLTNFAKKLSTNQLKPMGPSLWIPDIVHDLHHSFPPANVERIENLVNVPEQYINYMKQYGDYEEDDETEQDQSIGGQDDQDDSCQDTKMAAQAYFKNYQAGQNFYQQVQHQHDQNGYTGDYNTYEDYYQDREQQEKMNNSYNKQQNSRPPSHASAQNISSPHTSGTTTHKSSKRRLSAEDGDSNTPKVKRPAADDKGSRSQSQSPTSDMNDTNNHTSEKSFKIKLPSLSNGNNNNNNNNTRSSTSPTSNSQPSRSNTPKSEMEQTTTNGHTSPTASSDTNAKELESYAQAIDYLKPLEDFALFTENFRAIGLLAQLEAVLRKGELAAVLGVKKQT